MFKNILNVISATLIIISAIGSTSLVHAQTSADALVRQISVDVIDTAKVDKAIQAGDVGKVIALVEIKVMPHVNFEVITRTAVGPQWRKAMPEQRSKLQAEFKTLLIRVYAGALSQLREQSVEVTKTVPMPGGTQFVVQTEVRGGKGEPIKLDYRLEKATDASAWKIIDVNVGGLWVVQNYRSQFAQELTKGGLDGLIDALAERNKVAAKS